MVYWWYNESFLMHNIMVVLGSVVEVLGSSMVVLSIVLAVVEQEQLLIHSLVLVRCRNLPL